MPNKQKLIGNIAFELCDTEAPGLKYDKTFGGMQKYIQHQRYSHHVMKEYDSDKNSCKRWCSAGSQTTPNTEARY